MISNVNSTAAAFALSYYLKVNQGELNESLNRVATGLRVRTPKDDPGAYFQATNYGRRAAASSIVARDLEDNITSLKSAQESLNEVKGLLQQAAGLALKASNSDDDNLRASLAAEFANILTQIDTVINTSTFDGNNLISAAQTITVQVDEDVTSTLSYSLFSTARTAAAGLNLGNAGGVDYGDPVTLWGSGGVDAVEKAAAADFYAAYNGTRPDDTSAAGLVNLDRNINRMSTTLLILENRQKSLNNKAANYEAARSTLVGVDEAQETTRLTSLQIQQQAAAFFLAQSNGSRGSISSLLLGAR